MPFLYQLTNPAVLKIPGCLDDGEIAIAHLSRADATSVTDSQAREMARCYVCPQILSQLAAANELTVAAQIEEMLPNQPHLMAGDVGEMLMRQYLLESPEGPSVPVYRWRNRSTRNDTVRGTDLIAYCKRTHLPAPEDLLILCEVKTRSATINAKVAEEALDGAKKDYASRLANSIVFAQARLINDSMANEASALARFRKPHLHPFRTKVLGAVVHESATWDDAFLGHLPVKHDLPIEAGITILKIEDFASWIRELFVATTTQAEHA